MAVIFLVSDDRLIMVLKISGRMYKQILANTLSYTHHISLLPHDLKKQKTNKQRQRQKRHLFNTNFSL